MKIQQHQLDRAITCVGAGSLILIAVWIALGQTAPIADENWYLATVSQLLRHGFSVSFLRDLPGPAGPLYTLVQAIAWPFTGGQAHLARWVSWICLCLAIPYLAGAWGASGRSKGWTRAWILVCIPVIQLAAGTALTDMPAFLPFCIHLFFLAHAISVPESRRIRYAIFAGFALGIAATGRQQVLGFLLCTPLLVSRRALGWTPTAGYLASAAMLPLALFAIWKGMTPPATQWVSKGGVSFFYGFCGVGYAGLFYFLLQPERVLQRLSALAGFFFLCLFAILGYEAVVSPLPIHVFWKSGFGRVLNAPGLYVLARVLQALLFAIGLRYFFDVWENRRRGGPLDRICQLGALGVVATTFRITHQFSSRYVLLCIPLFLLAEGGRLTLARAVVLAFAALFGLRSLAAYLGVFG